MVKVFNAPFIVQISLELDSSVVNLYSPISSVLAQKPDYRIQHMKQ